MQQLRHTLTIIVSLATVGCGPPRIGSGPNEEQGSPDTAGSDTTGSDTTGSDTTGSDTTTGDPMEPEPTTTTSPFIIQPDVLHPDECDPFEQDCPEGEKCVPYGSSGGNWDANKCVPVMGDQKPGEPCWYGGVVEATDDCDETSTCWDVINIDDELIGTCVAFCAGHPDNPECPSSSSCLISSNGSLNLCIHNCDPLLQDCSPGLACYWANGNFNCIFTTQDIPAGEPCGFINDCAAGLLCLTAEVVPDCAGSACCGQFCDLMLGDAQCDAVPGTVCVSFFEEGAAPPGYELVGVCISP